MLQLAKRVLSVFDPPPVLKVWEWAELRRKMDREVTARPGRYSVDFAPYQKEPQESFTDKEVQITCLPWAKRMGKTETINNLFGWVIECDPRNILSGWPIVETARKYSKQFFMPMIRSTDYLKEIISDARVQYGTNTMLQKQFPGGTISFVGASPHSFRQVQAPVIALDEIDGEGWNPDKEGDKVLLALGRSENYRDCIQVLSSTPTILETSRIWAWYEKSDKRHWFVKSPCCGKSHVLAWSQVKWPKNKPEEAYYECPDCGSHWDDKRRLEAIRAGEWRPTAPFNGIRGYWLNGLNSVFEAKKGFRNKLHQFAAEFLDAYHAGEAARIAWKNTFLCEPHHQEAEEPPPEKDILERREHYSPQNLPEQVICLGMPVDVQADRLEYEIIGLGLDDETWGIEYGKFIGNPDRQEVWDNLRAKLAETFRRSDGVQLKINFCAIDHRHKGDKVRRFVKTCGLPNVYAVYGVGRSQQSLLVIPHKNKLYRIHLFSVNTDIAKDALFSSLKLLEPGPRYLHFPIGYGYDAESGYFKQLTAEKKVPRYHKGFLTYEYVKEKNRRNEAIDLRSYFWAAVDIRRPPLKQMAADLLLTKREYQLRPVDPEKPKPPQRRRMSMAPGLQELMR